MLKIFLVLIISIFASTSGREKPPECLIRPADGFRGYRGSRIAGGSEAELGQFPWHVHMTLYDDIGLKMCGGALIKPKWVLTVSFEFLVKFSKN
jgi:hypothetical protein